MKRIAVMTLAAGVIAMLLASRADTALASSAHAKSQSTPLTATNHDDLPPYISLRCVRNGDTYDEATLYLGLKVLFNVTISAYAAGTQLRSTSVDTLAPGSTLPLDFAPAMDEDNYAVFTWIPAGDDYPSAEDRTRDCPGG